MAVKDLYDKACEAVNKGNYDYAIELFREVLRMEPDYPGARVLLRGTERRRLAESGGSLVQALAAQAKGLWPLLKASLHFKNHQKKLEYYEDYLEDNPNSIGGLMAAGAAARNAGHLDSAIIILKDLLSLRANNKKAMRLLGQTFEEGGRPSDAVKVLNALAALEPNDQQLQHQIRNLEALDHMQMTKMEDAGSFRDMIRDKEFTEESIRRLETASERGTKQIEEASQALAAEPENVSRITGLAILYEHEGMYEEACTLLRQARQRMPDNYEIREVLGDLRLHMCAHAVGEIDRKLKADPDNQQWLQQKQKLESQGRELAVQEYGWRVSQHPTDTGLRLGLGQGLFGKGDLDGAIASLQVAVRDPRLEVKGAAMLGQCFVAKKQYDLAVSQYERAIARRPELDQTGMELHYALAGTLELMGNRERALQVYKKIYSNDISFRDVGEKVDALSQ